LFLRLSLKQRLFGPLMVRLTAFESFVGLLAGFN